MIFKLEILVERRYRLSGCCNVAESISTSEKT